MTFFNIKTFFNTVTIRTLILSAFLILVLALTALGSYSLYEMGGLSDEQKAMFEENLAPLVLVANAQNEFMSYRIQIYVHMTSDDPALKRNTEQQLTLIERRLHDKLGEYAKTITNREEKAIYEQFQPQWTSYKAVVEKILAQSNQTGAEGSAAALRIAMTEAPEKVNALQSTLEQIFEYNKNHADKAYQSGVESYGVTRTITIIVILLAAAASLGVGFGLASAIAAPLRSIEEVAAAVASGDLNQKVTAVQGKNEIASLSRSISEMIENLRALILKVVEGSTQVAAASEQISASTQQMASGAQNQANEAQELSSIPSSAPSDEVKKKFAGNQWI